MTDNNKEYIRCENFKTARTIFMVYSDMIEVKANYKGSHKNTKCEACNKDEETTEHLIKCPKYEDITKELKNKSSVRNLMKENKPVDIAKAFEKILEKRKEIMGSKNRDPVSAPPSG